MTPEAERFNELIDAKLADLERRTAAGDSPTAAELNAVRRLLVWREREREFEQARDLSRPSAA